MPVDASIYGGVQPQQQANPLNALAQAYQIKGLQSQMDRSDREAMQQNKLLELVQSPSFAGLGTAQKAAALQGVGAFDQAGKLVTTEATANKDRSASAVSEFDLQAKKLDMLSNLAATVTDQPSYDRARAIAQQQGLDVSKWNPQYDPAGVAQFAQATLGAKERLNAQVQREGQQITRQNNIDTNATSASNNANTVAATDRATNQRATTAAAAQVQKTAPKPLPAAALKMQQEGLDAIGTASSINSDLDAVNQQITEGKLKFGPVGNLANKALNAAGMSTDESRNFASFQANMEKLRNDSLRLNKGVQTDGDAQRAWNELFSNINDTKVVQQRLGEIKRLNERAVELRKLDIDNVRSNYGQDPLDTEKYSKVPTALNGGNKGGAPDLSSLEAELKRRGLLK
jgi:hypothetical protein